MDESVVDESVSVFSGHGPTGSGSVRSETPVATLNASLMQVREASYCSLVAANVSGWACPMIEGGAALGAPPVAVGIGAANASGEDQPRRRITRISPVMSESRGRGPERSVCSLVLDQGQCTATWTVQFVCRSSAHFDEAMRSCCADRSAIDASRE